MYKVNLLTRLSTSVLFIGVASINYAETSNSKPNSSKSKPNILLIMADDLGYSDIGAFGSEIHTPNIDALAHDGRIFTDYHTAPSCSPTRAQLLSGTDHHQAGLGAMREARPAHLDNNPGYEGYLNERSLSIAEILKDNGYHTYISGKWHLGMTPETNAKAKGFERSFTLIQGADSHFKNSPEGSARRAIYTLDGARVPISSFPDHYFSTDYYTDKLIEFIDKNKESQKPFFAYAAYTAPHAPIQAPAIYSDKYKGIYNVGYDVIRNARIKKQKELGIISTDLKPANTLDTVSSLPNNKQWQELSPIQKANEARRMEVYAGMIDNLDHNVGRLVAYLKDTNQYDNTLIFFVSDNGPDAGDIEFPIPKNYNNTYESIGTENSYIFLGARWAEVSAAPFHLWKATAGEGATTVPAIVKLPQQLHSENSYQGFTSVLDILPTVLDVANINIPKNQYNGRKINNPTGYSWKKVLENKSSKIRPDNFTFADELHGFKYTKKDGWKIAYQARANLGTGTWELYNLKNDRGETSNLANSNLNKVKELVETYQQYKKDNGVAEYFNK